MVGYAVSDGIMQPLTYVDIPHDRTTEQPMDSIEVIMHLLSTYALVFPLVPYGFESWTVRRAERKGIDSFKLRCWRRLLRMPRTARRTNKSVIE